MINYILIATMLIGVVLIIISIKSFNKEPQSTQNYLEVENTISVISTSVAEADNAISQLNKLSKSVFDEFEEKYQELLFLYSLVDDKRKEVSELYSKPPEIKNATLADGHTRHFRPAPKKTNKPVSKSPYFDDIMQLFDEGASVSDISKALNLGQGEVKLILEMGRDR